MCIYRTKPIYAPSTFNINYKSILEEFLKYEKRYNNYDMTNIFINKCLLDNKN